MNPTSTGHRRIDGVRHGGLVSWAVQYVPGFLVAAAGFDYSRSRCMARAVSRANYILAAYMASGT